MRPKQLKEFTEAAADLKRLHNNPQRKTIIPTTGANSHVSEAYQNLIEDLTAVGMNPNDPTGAGDLVDTFDRELALLIEEYRAIIKTALNERMREESPVRVRSPTVDVKSFSETVTETSDEINEKGRKIIEKRTKEGYLLGVNFAGQKLKPYKIKIGFKMPYDQTVIEALQTRNTAAFKGVLDEQGKQIMRQVTEGALNKETVRDIAKRIDSSVDGIGRVRSETIARTELMGAVNTGVRNRFESAGMTKLKRVETLDARICTTWTFNNVVIAGRTWKGCISIAGKVFSLADAALIDTNTHPNERGTWVPYISGVSPPAPMAEEG